MKPKFMSFIYRKICESRIIRTLIKPIMIFKNQRDLTNFSKTVDAEYIRRYKGKYEGKRCFIIGNGPSLSAVDLDSIKGEISFACNRIYNIFDKTIWRPTFYVCADRVVLFDEIDNIKKLDGPVKFVSTRAKKYGRTKQDKLHYFLMSGPFEINLYNRIQDGVSTDCSRYLSITQTVACNMLELAMYMGFKEIYLLGVDHNYPISIDKNGNRIVDESIKSHFEGGGSKEKSIHVIFTDATTACYKVCEDYARGHGIKIYNATRGGKLEVFERIELERVLNCE